MWFGNKKQYMKYNNGETVKAECWMIECREGTLFLSGVQAKPELPQWGEEGLNPPHLEKWVCFMVGERMQWNRGRGETVALLRQGWIRDYYILTHFSTLSCRPNIIKKQNFLLVPSLFIPFLPCRRIQLFYQSLSRIPELFLFFSQLPIVAQATVSSHL